jgi:hypothetical protein
MNGRLLEERTALEYAGTRNPSARSQKLFPPKPDFTVERLEFRTDPILQACQEIVDRCEIRLIGASVRHGSFESSYG